MLSMSSAAGEIVITVLGPVRALVGGRPCDLGSPKQRAVLALLALAAGRVVSTDHLMDELWGEQAPPTAAATLQTYVSRLRRSFAEAAGVQLQGAPVPVLRRAPGYLLEIPPDQVDALRFARLAAAGTASLGDDPDTAYRQLERALALVGGSPLADVVDQLGEAAAAETRRLEDLMIAAQEARLEAMLRSGRATEAAVEAAALARKHPLREGIAATLALSLHVTGRQGEALAAYDRIRRSLIEELGVEPGPSLRRLHAQMLRQDPALQRIVSRRRAASSDVVEVPLPEASVSTMVGRGEAMDSLRRALAGLRQRHGSVWLVSGEGGIGKTRLAEEVAAHAAAAGVAVAWGRAQETAAGSPFWPWEQILRSLPDIPVDDAVALVLGAGGTEPGGAAPSVRARTFDAVARALMGQADRQPLLLVLDDLHWADEPTLQLAAAVAELAFSGPLMMVGTFRSEDADPGSPLGALLASLARQRQGQRLALHGLEASDITRLVTGHLGQEPPKELLAAALQRSDGNPFFVLELCRLLQVGSASAADLSAEVPATVRDVILRRLTRLSGPARQVLDVASVIGRDCDLALLQSVTILDFDTLDAALAEVVGAALVTEHAQLRTRIRFQHALVRETVYAELRPSRRARWHAVVGERMVLLPGGEVDADELAFHLLAGADIVGALAVMPPLLEAARLANSRLAYEHADRLLEHAASLVDRLPAGVDRDTADLTVSARRGSLLATQHGWAAPAARVWLDRARQLSTRVEPGIDAFAAQYGTMAAACVSGDFLQTLSDARLLLSRSRQPGVAGRRWELLGRWFVGVASWHLGDHTSAISELEQAVELAEEVGDGVAEALFQDPSIMLRSFLALSYALTGRGAEADATLAEAIRRAELSGSPFELCCATLFGAFRATVDDDVPTTARLAARTSATAREHGFVLYELMGAQLGGWSQAVLPDHGPADDPRRVAGRLLLRRALVDFTATGAGMLRTMFLELCSQAELVTGQPGQALATADEGLAVGAANGEGIWRARLERQRDRSAAAVAAATADPSSV